MLEGLLASLIVLGVTNLGALIFFLGGIRTKVDSHEGRINELESGQTRMVGEIGELKGRIEAHT